MSMKTQLIIIFPSPMKPHLDSIALQIEQEILRTGTITLNGRSCHKNSLRDNPYAGLCGYAVEKLKELAPNLEIKTLRFSVIRPGGRINHVVAEIDTPEGTYVVDPTIRQFLPQASAVYGPQEKYPLRIAAESMNKISYVQLPK